MGDSALSVVPISMPEVSISTMKRMPSSSIVVLRLNFRISSIAIKRRAFFSPKRRGIVSAVRGRSLSVGLPIFLLHSCDVVKVHHLISTRLKRLNFIDVYISVHYGINGKRTHTLHSQFFHNVLTMCNYGCHSDIELVGNFFINKSLHDQ